MTMFLKFCGCYFGSSLRPPNFFCAHRPFFCAHHSFLLRPPVSRSLNTARSCHVNAMFLPRPCYVLAMLLPRSCHVLAMLLLLSCQVIAMFLPRSCHFLASLLPCHCHAPAAYTRVKSNELNHSNSEHEASNSS